MIHIPSIIFFSKSEVTIKLNDSFIEEDIIIVSPTIMIAIIILVLHILLWILYMRWLFFIHVVIKFFKEIIILSSDFFLHWCHLSNFIIIPNNFFARCSYLKIPIGNNF